MRITTDDLCDVMQRQMDRIAAEATTHFEKAGADRDSGAYLMGSGLQRAMDIMSEELRNLRAADREDG